MDDIEILLKKLAEGTLTASEESFLFEWLREHKDEWSLSMYDRYRQALEQDARFLFPEKSSRVLRGIHSRIDAGDSPYLENFTPAEPGKRRLPVFFLGVAASLALLLILGGRLLFPAGQESGAAYERVSSLPAARKIVNEREQVMPVALPDGSSVLLYPQSVLTYAPFPETGNREVFLEGRAFFEVMRNPEKPFLVHTNGMETRVLGTSFMVDAYENQRRYSVLVKTGSVAVSGKGNKQEESAVSVTLRENEEVIFDRNSEAFIAAGPSSEAKLSGNIVKVPGEYRFRDTPVTDILDMLSRDYNVRIEADREVLANCSLTTFLKDKPLFEKLRIICGGIGEGTSFSVKEETVIITSLGCNN